MGERDGGGVLVLIQLRTVDETGSTNDEVALLARDGAAEGLWLRAGRQTNGRGRQGRGWIAPPGNLSASTLVRLRAGDPPAPTLALVAGVALHEALAAFAPDAGLSIKWPNDVVAGDAKLAGILLERHGDAVVVGCGANLAHRPDLPDRATTALARLTGAAPDPDAVLRTLADTFARWLAVWRGAGAGPAGGLTAGLAAGLAVVARRWREHAHPPGSALAVALPDGATLHGLFAGLDEGGALTLRLADGTVRVIHAGDVSWDRG